MIKVLAIGNSFSEDATAKLESFNKDIFVRNMYFGGCTLEQHCNFYKNGEKNYAYQKDGVGSLPNLVDLVYGLTQEKWDIITVQQASGKSGKFETIDPYLEELISIIKKYSDAKIMWHQTWPYERNSTHPDFPSYSSSTEKMWDDIQDATKKVEIKYGLEVIPSGRMIVSLMNKPAFDVRAGGKSIQRDGFHLSFEYGRYAAALVWDYVLTGSMPEDLKTKDSPEFNAIKEAATELFNLK